MPELITIEEAARITGFPSEDIQYWAKSHKNNLLLRDERQSPRGSGQPA